MEIYIFLALKIIVAIILIRTLRYKFLAHPESVYIFEQAGIEPWGRIGIGVLELIASILLFIPTTSWVGAALTLGLMSGAILLHLTKIGVEVKGDKKALFYTAIVTLILSFIILFSEKGNIPFLNL